METKKISAKEFNEMPADEQASVLMKMVKIEGVGVVRDEDGNIKYDDPSQAGTFGENDGSSS